MEDIQQRNICRTGTEKEPEKKECRYFSTLRKHSDGSELPYSAPNLTTLLSGVTDPIFVLRRVGYPLHFRLGIKQSSHRRLILLGTCCYHIQISHLESSNSRVWEC
jgi:hypothetical protein